jgi:hypothetical protein
VGLTLTRIKEGEDVLGGRTRSTLYDITLDTSYPAGGYPLTAPAVGLKILRGMSIIGGNALAASFRPFFDNVNNLLAVNAGGGGTQVYSPGGGDIKGSANTDSENVDAAAGVTNGALISTSAAVSTLVAGALLIALQPDVARNVVIQIENTTGGALNLFEGVSSIAVVGTFRGAAQTETITITSTAGNKSVAAAKFRYKYGVKPFDTITSITITNLPAATLNIAAGIGSQLGLPTPLLTPAEADVLKITKTGADLSPSGLVSTTNQTVNLGTLADGNDVSIEYRAGGAAATGSDLSGVKARCMFFGE